MSTQQWVTCPQCGTGYYFIWEYAWDNKTKCVHCAAIWECVLELEEDETDAVEETVEEKVITDEETEYKKLQRELEVYSGLYTEESVRESLLKELRNDGREL